MPITHLPAEGYRRMPWKNGAGTTTEIAVAPAGSGLDEFDWRLAIADLDRSGPFSSFPGVDRLLMLLPPGEVILEIDGRQRAMAPLDVVAFAGESAVSTSLASGPARDLNLMLRRGRVEATMEAVVLEAERRLPVHGSLIVLCAIDGSVGIESDGAQVVLEMLDSAIVEPAESREITLRPAGRAVLAVIAIRP
jgi:environmental stress-induced protein Ves